MRARDGRFLMNIVADDVPPITIMQNLTARLKK
jgi:hypothetical protein